MNRKFVFAGTAMLFLVVSACQETSDTTTQLTTTKMPDSVVTSSAEANNDSMQANATANTLSLGRLAIPTTQHQQMNVPLAEVAKNESKNAEAEPNAVAAGDTVVPLTTQELWQLAPKMETFVVKAEEENTMELAQGSVIEIPKDAFVYAGTNEPVTGNVAIMAKEYRNMSDCVTAGLTTMSDKGLLESGGMMYIDAVADGRKCALRKDKPMKIALPSWGKKDERMKLFTGNRKKNGQVVWKEMSQEQGEQLPESEAPKRPEPISEDDIYPSLPFTVVPSQDSSFQGFVTDKMLPVFQYKNCGGNPDVDVYREKNRSGISINLRGASFQSSYHKGISYFPVSAKRAENTVKERPILKITQENHLTNVDKLAVPKHYVSLTGKTLKALTLAYEDKWQEQKDANNRSYYVTKKKPLQLQLELKEEKTFCKVYVKTNQRGTITSIAFREYNFILTEYMYKWLLHQLKQRVWKPNVEGVVLVDIYVSKRDFRKMKKWYGIKANTLAECKQRYETQYQHYLAEIQAAQLPPEELQKREQLMTEYKAKLARYKKRQEEKAALRYKSFEQDYNAGKKEANAVQYVFRTNMMGWVNCDYFYNKPMMVMNLKVKGAEKNTKVQSIVIFKERKVVLNQCHQESYVKVTLPREEEVFLWVIKEDKGKRYFSLQEIITGKNNVEVADFEELTFEKLQELTDKFSKISET